LEFRRVLFRSQTPKHPYNNWDFTQRMGRHAFLYWIIHLSHCRQLGWIWRWYHIWHATDSRTVFRLVYYHALFRTNGPFVNDHWPCIELVYITVTCRIAWINHPHFARHVFLI